MAESLEDRLKSHAESFNGLLALIPAERYYGKDTSDQWQRKKQTKQEARAAKLAKLDPENAKSAKDIMDENARKRKREEDGVADDGADDGHGVDIEKPLEGLKRTTKKQKKNTQASKDGGKRTKDIVPTSSQQDGSESNQQAEKKVKNKQPPSEKAKEKLARRKAKREAAAAKARQKEVESQKKELQKLHKDQQPAEHGLPDEAHIAGGSSSLPSISTASPSLKAHSPSFDIANPHSGISSISSIVPTSVAESKPPSEAKGMAKALAEYKANPEELKRRLREKIEALRAARHADNIDGTPARTRQELLEVRRKRQEQRSAHKKELRRQAREAEAHQHELALQHASPLLSPAIKPSRTNGLPLDDPPNHLAFGRIAFANGQYMTPDLGSVLDPRKRKGPRDAAGALIAANKRVERLAALDPEKKADIDEKDAWLTARKRAHGERVHDDTTLLARTLKRKERAKRVSEKEWAERTDSVTKAQAARQKKREDNLAKRRNEKGAKKGKKRVKSKKPKVKPRPGFEGSFRANVGGSERR